MGDTIHAFFCYSLAWVIKTATLSHRNPVVYDPKVP